MEPQKDRYFFGVVNDPLIEDPGSQDLTLDAHQRHVVIDLQLTNLASLYFLVNLLSP
jgi:hypothetical protein